MKIPNYVFDDELYHHGILGQRWGHRRYQNEDGSWTPEGRERYGEGDERSKAKISYNTQKYKADLKSKARQDKDIRAAKEERNRIKENSKTMLLARKKQGAFDRLNKKEEAKLDRQGRPKFGMGKTKNMSDEDLERAINRLKLQAEYNKQYTLATKPNSALAKADRFFEGPTGKMVRDIAVATIPNVANTATTKLLESKLKYANKEDRDKIAAETESFKAKADNQRATSEQIRQKIENDKNESQAKIRNEERESISKWGEHVQKVRNQEKDATIEQFRNKQKAATEAAARQAIFSQQKAGKITVDEALDKLKKLGLL